MLHYNIHWQDLKVTKHTFKTVNVCSIQTACVANREAAMNVMKFCQHSPGIRGWKKWMGFLFLQMAILE